MATVKKTAKTPERLFWGVTFDPPLKPVRVDGRGKIDWYHYATKEDCLAVMEWVVTRGRNREAAGYDSGWLGYGMIQKCADGTWRICVL